MPQFWDVGPALIVLIVGARAFPPFSEIRPSLRVMVWPTGCCSRWMLRDTSEINKKMFQL